MRHKGNVSKSRLTNLKKKSKPVNPAKEPKIELEKHGRCVANCTNLKCPRGMQPIDQFLPAVSNITHKKRAKMLKLVEKLHSIQVKDSNDSDDEDVCTAKLLLERIASHRAKHCKTCRDILKKSRGNSNTKYGACRAKWLEIKADLERRRCSVCGRNDGMSVEHTIPSEKKRDKKGNFVNLSDYSKWKSLGGPEAMQAEYDKPSVVPMCLNCNYMQPTCNMMKPKLNPDELPDGKQGKNATCEEVAAYKKKQHLIEKHKKQEYVDNIKLKYVNQSGQVATCDDCSLKMISRGSKWSPGYTAYPHVFQFAHRSEMDKKDGVAELVNSTRYFKTVKPLIDKEIKRSRLLCMCCAKTETDARNSCPGPSEEGN